MVYLLAGHQLTAGTGEVPPAGLTEVSQHVQGACRACAVHVLCVAESRDSGEDVGLLVHTCASMAVV